MGLAVRPRRPRHRCLPRGRERLRRGLARTSTRTSSTPSSTRSRRGRRRRTRACRAARARGGTSAGRSRGSRTRSTAGAAPRPRRPRSSSSTRTPQAEGQGFFELGRVRREPRARSARLVGRRDRARGVHAAHPRPGHRHRPARRGWRAPTTAPPGRPTSATSSTPLPDHAMRPYQVWRHALGTAQADDVLVYEEPDERYNVDLGLTRSGALHPDHERGQHLDGRARAARGRPPRDAAARRRAPSGHRVPAGPLGRPVRDPHQPRRPRLQGGHRALRRPRARAGSISCPTRRGAGSRRWRPSPITSRSHEWAHALERIRMLRLDGSERTLAFDEAVYSVEIGTNLEYETSTLRFGYESLVVPHSIFEEDVVSGDRQLLKRTPVLGGYDPADYDSAREWATAPDGARGARRCGVAAGHTPGRDGAAVALRLRRLRVLAAAVVLDPEAVVPRPRGGLGADPPPWRRRARSRLVPGRQDAGQAQHVHRLHRLRRAPGGTGVRLRRTG